MAVSFLVTRSIPAVGLDRLRRGGSVKVNPYDRPMTADELVMAAADCDGIVSMLTDRIDVAFLDRCPRVKAISNYAVGFNNIDVAECTRRGIGVSNTPDVLTNATAEIAMGLMLACARRLVEADGVVRGGQWRGWAPLDYLGVDMVGKVLGIIGAGRIGLRVAKMAAGFDMQVLYYSRGLHREFDQIGAVRVDLEGLLREADFVSLHAPLTDQTRHIIGAKQLAMMKPAAILINTARGPLVDEQALVEALRENRIFAAGLDVFEHEPMLSAGLASLKNAILLPHIGSATVATRGEMAVMAAEDLLAMSSGKRPVHPVNPQRWG
ncbi:MAG: D-glycerate dehydrogenase [Phycisphaerae bacterium]|nr:D-glycerate dehydrogenase [Phycisphaerae bacterium]